MTEKHLHALSAAREATTSELHEAHAELSARFNRSGPVDTFARLNLWAVKEVLMERGELNRPDNSGPGAYGYRE